MSCYCCYSGSNKQMTASRQSHQMDMGMDQLNNALHELGMLSSVTNSRKQYLEEKSRSRYDKGPSQPGTSKCHFRTNNSSIQTNQDFVSQLVGYWDLKAQSEDLAAVEDTESCMYKYSEENVDALSTTNRVSKMKPMKRTRYRFQKPYEVPWRRFVEERCRPFGDNLNQDSDSSRDSGLGNRSNPDSPERTVALEPCTQDVENMSQKMEDLQILGNT